MKLSKQLKKTDVTINMTPRGLYLSTIITKYLKVVLISYVACGFSKFHKV